MQQLWLEIYKHTDLSTIPEITGQFSVNPRKTPADDAVYSRKLQKKSFPDEIAAQSMISKSSALNLFRSYLHITPVNYLINYRLKQAALLLSHTEKKVSTISAETGFHNVDYFCRAFKKHYQVTPGEYRKEKWDK
ncbi:MAG: helix-turn-helix transcriptional regulator [Ruminococcus sp.]